MKLKVSTILYTFLFLLHGMYSYASVAPIKGRVSDAVTGKALPGATVTIPELRISVTTDKNGEYTFSSIPERGNFLVEVRYIGYRSSTQKVNLSDVTPVNFALQPSVIEVHEVVVTGSPGSSSSQRNSTSVTSVSKEEMLRRPSNNIIDALSKVPGVSQITTGAAVSKPVIRGLSYNRIITLNEGVKQEGQQWGDEHGIEMDQFSADKVEILRGAASLLYGSDALGGVINILDPFPPAPGQIKGEILTNYATNNGLSGSSAMLQGNANGFIWKGRGSYKNAFGYNTPDGRIPNTGFHETDLSGQIGFNKKWGYTHLDVSSFRQKLGLPEFERNDDGQFIDEDGEVLPPSEIKTRDMLLPFQDIRHYKAALNSYILLGSGRLRSTFGYQNNQRRELEESATDPSLFFDLKTYSYDLKYYFAEKNGWEPVIGISGQHQDNKNKAAELLIPDYTSNAFGAFAYIKKNWESSTVNAGLRFDHRNLDGKEMETEEETKFSDFSNNLSNISGALGFTHQFGEQLTLKANAGSAFRAPNIAELSADGVHEGTFRYEKGDVSLKPERTFSSDASLEYHSDKADFHFSLYDNYINNYIYLRQFNNQKITVTDEESGEEQEVDLYNYVQDNANLYGMEAGLTLHPVSLIHFQNTFALTRAKNRETKNDLPFTPAPVLRNELRFEPAFGSSAFRNTWFSVGLDNFFKQTHVDPEFETPTDAYTLVNASAGTTLMVNRQALRLTLSVSNLFDKAYIDHLSRFKTEGLLNQGRNISFGIYVPLTLKGND